MADNKVLKSPELSPEGYTQIYCAYTVIIEGDEEYVQSRPSSVNMRVYLSNGSVLSERLDTPALGETEYSYRRYILIPDGVNIDMFWGEEIKNYSLSVEYEKMDNLSYRVILTYSYLDGNKGYLYYNGDAISTVKYKNDDIREIILNGERVWRSSKVLGLSGDCTITTAIPGGDDLSFEMKIKVTNTTQTQCLWCTRDDISVNTNTCFYIANNGYRRDYNNVQYATGVTSNAKEAQVIRTYEIKPDGTRDNRVFYVNDVKYNVDLPSGTFTPSSTVRLFSSTNGSNQDSGNLGAYVFYYCKVWKGNELIGDFIPAFEGDVMEGKVASVTCLYDRVSHKFRVPTLGGTFRPFWSFS